MDHERWDYRYLELALRIDKQSPGLVDSFFGPAEIASRVERDPSVGTPYLLNALGELQDSLGDVEEPGRRQFLEHQLAGIEVVVRKLHGEAIPFEREVRACYDLDVEEEDATPLREAHDSLQKDLNCCRDDLASRLAEWRSAHVTPRHRIQRLWEDITREARTRTAKLLPLAPRERVNLRLVKKRPWSGYNWYRGQFVSDVELNTDLNIYTCFLPGLAMHEAYPGHHTERCIKEKVLFEENGFAEASVLLYGTPECVISEGIGQCARYIVFTDDESLLTWCNGALGTSFEVERDARILRAVESLDLRGRVAIMLSRDQIARAEAEDFVMKWGLKPRAEAAKVVDFAEKYGPYAIGYQAGALIVREAISVDSPIGLYDLYSRQLTPSILKEQLACP